MEEINVDSSGSSGIGDQTRNERCLTTTFLTRSSRIDTLKMGFLNFFY